MKSRFSPGQLLLMIGVLVGLVTLIQAGALTIAFHKLGLSPDTALLLLITSLFGSVINLPLFTMAAEGPSQPPPTFLRGLLRPHPMPFTGKTLVAMNVGGGLVPISFSVYLMGNSHAGLWHHAMVILGVSLISYLVSRPIHGIGIGMPIFIAPVAAALLALLVNPEHSAALAYSGGTLGVLIGADLLRLKDIRTMGTPIASIGGAGTFDGIFISGIVAVLLA
ncbi:MAG: DUF1614 domain-containing protein [Gammaproteobacteria bacterium]|nr:DUF1614 domain-containing protein [Gammaproteobacteria bacterium]